MIDQQNQQSQQNQIDWERLANPSPLFRIFMPTKEKIDFFKEKLMNEYLYLPDEKRNPFAINQLIFFYFSGGNIVYEIGEMDGICEFLNIMPEYKCSSSMKIWNPEKWGATGAREGRELINLIIDSFKLKRISTESPDPIMAKMAKILGFKEEGKEQKAFRWNGEFYDNYKLSIIID